MPVILYRVDERLIHGQVVVGWGAALHPQRLVVVDSELAESPWEQELYTLGMPPEVEAVFESVEGARGRLGEWQADPVRTILLTRDIGTMQALGDNGGLEGTDVNIGGIHYAPGRDRVLPYVFLSEQDREQLRSLAAKGARITAQDVPSTRKVDLAKLVDGAPE